MSSSGFNSSDEDVDRPATVSNYLPAPLQIDWLTLPAWTLPSGHTYISSSVGITSLPGCRFRTTWRNLRDDLGTAGLR